MPIKFGAIQNAQFFVKEDGEYKPLGHISESVLTVTPTNPPPEEEYKSFFSSEPMEFTAKFTVNPRAFYIFVLTGNDLYLRFPKKLKRRRKRWYE